LVTSSGGAAIDPTNDRDYKGLSAQHAWHRADSRRSQFVQDCDIAGCNTGRSEEILNMASTQSLALDKATLDDLIASENPMVLESMEAAMQTQKG
jgi:hypothetical protein